MGSAVRNERSDAKKSTENIRGRPNIIAKADIM